MFQRVFEMAPRTSPPGLQLSFMHNSAPVASHNVPEHQRPERTRNSRGGKLGSGSSQ